MKKVVEGNQHYGNGQKIVFDICVTKWVENFDANERFLSAITYIVKALQVTAHKMHKMHLESYPDWGVWDTTSRKRASACLSILLDIFFFNFDPVSTKYVIIMVSKNSKIISGK